MFQLAPDNPLRKAGYRYFLLFSACGAMGGGFHFVAGYWIIFEHTSSPSSVALLILAFWMPSLLVLPVGGVIVDRCNRRRTLAALYIYLTTLNMLLVLLIALEVFRPGHLYWYGMASSVAHALIWTALTAWLQEAFSRDELLHANSLNVALFQGGYLLGAGSAGLVTAYIAAAVKAKVTLIERHRMGGDCLNTGCVPSKALIKTAKLMNQVRHARDYGVKSAAAELDFAQAMERVKGVVAAIEPHDSVERYARLGVECVKGNARITSPWTVEVDLAEGGKYSAAGFLAYFSGRSTEPAKMAELLDFQVYSATAGAISGHSLKHLLAAAAVLCVWRMLQRRQSLTPVASSQ